MATQTSIAVWNRACYGGGENPAAGDRALAALLKLHGAAMNGGPLHAVEALSADERQAAEAGYRYFGLPEVARLLVKARQIFESGEDLDEHEHVLVEQYGRLASDSVLQERFEARFASHPGDFAPLH